VAGKYVLVDTSAWILALKIGLATRARSVIDDLLAGRRIAIIPIIRLELLGGTKSQAEFQRLDRRLGALHQLPLAKAEWDESAGLAFRLRRAGVTIPYTDVIIAAAAILHGLPLIHADRHFDLIAGQVTLKAENLLA
jgi:predicted nucleic acid-binding protein